jgi:hypothetical protein
MTKTNLCENYGQNSLNWTALKAIKTTLSNNNLTYVENVFVRKLRRKLFYKIGPSGDHGSCRRRRPSGRSGGWTGRRSRSRSRRSPGTSSMSWGRTLTLSRWRRARTCDRPNFVVAKPLFLIVVQVSGGQGDQIGRIFAMGDCWL